MYQVYLYGKVVGVYNNFVDAWLFAALDLAGTSHIKGGGEEWIVNPLYDPSKMTFHTTTSGIPHLPI